MWKTLTTNSITSIDIGLFSIFLFEYVGSLCPSGICFIQVIIFIGIKLFMILSYYAFRACRNCSSILSFDIDDVCHYFP